MKSQTVTMTMRVKMNPSPSLPPHWKLMKIQRTMIVRKMMKMRKRISLL